jgi:hypothetical protein
MTNEEKMRLIEEALELEENELKVDTVLDDIVQYDSMGKLSLIVLCDDEFDKKSFYKTDVSETYINIAIEQATNKCLKSNLIKMKEESFSDLKPSYKISLYD